MSDDELRALWLSGATVRQIARIAHTSQGAISGRIRRRRMDEGVERWPLRENLTLRPRKKPPHVKRAGTSTLPPLSSLR